MYRKSKQQLHTSRADAKDSSLSSTELVVPSCVSRVVSYPVVKDGYEKTMDFYQSRVRKSSFRVVRGLAAASEMGVGLGVGVGLTILKEGQRRTPSAIGDRLKLLDECAVTGLAALEHRFPIITQETDKVSHKYSIYSIVDSQILQSKYQRSYTIPICLLNRRGSRRATSSMIMCSRRRMRSSMER